MARGMTLIARDIMQTAVKSVRPDMSLADLDRWFLEQNVSGAPVVDLDGRLLGVVSRSDIVRQVSVGLTMVEVVFDFYGDYSIRGPSATALGGEMRSAVERLGTYRVRDTMCENVISVRADTPVKGVAAELVDRGIHRVLVNDERGRLAGVISTLDIARLVADGSVLEAA
jgi:CBS-domain-containing membrane protein